MSQPVTIPTAFDPADLPAWAQRNTAVVELCKRDLAYRCDVCRATTAQSRHVLRMRAELRHR